MPKVIVNSTPLIILGKIGYLNILNQLYGEVLLPLAVYDEVVVKDDTVKKEILKNSNWLKIGKVENKVLLNQLSRSLHKGEIEVIQLALNDKNNSLVILDDNIAKKMAKKLNLKSTGTLGVLIKAKERGFVSEVKPVLDKMLLHNFYIKPDLYKTILEITLEK